MKLGFIGCGNMAKAMLGGILKNEICAEEAPQPERSSTPAVTANI